MTVTTPRLAIAGGPATSTGGWPEWPEVDQATIATVADALRSRRWAISAPWNGSPSYEQAFARAFAEYTGTDHCVPVDHGSTSLVAALEALDVGPGDEVVVPVLTWIATATAVLNVNAVPVFADVDPATGCLSPDAVAAAVTPRTRAVIPVHLHCSMADLDGICDVAARHDLTVVEDCAQAHGARWRGRHAGSIGTLGAFSMQASKVLTCGEGGAVITSDATLYDRLQQLRADSRRYTAEPPEPGEMHLELAGDVMGTNYCLSEPQAALLLDQLGRLEGQLARRTTAAAELASHLAGVEGVSPIGVPAAVDRQSFYEYAAVIEPEAFGGRALDVVASALSAELGFPVYPTDQPLHRNPHYCPETKRRYLWDAEQKSRLRPTGTYPAADWLSRRLLVFPHQVLLADPSRMAEIAAAFDKVARFSHEL